MADDRAHEAEYETLRKAYPALPAWSALTDQQKSSVRAANEEKWSFFSDLGKGIRDGSIPTGLKRVS